MAVFTYRALNDQAAAVEGTIAADTARAARDALRGRGLIMDTASWGSSAEAQAYRQQQQDLISQGRTDDAIQMDYDDLRDKFGDKYDDMILDHIDHIPDCP